VRLIAVLALPLLAAPAVAGPAARGERQVTARELAGMGFFQDFADLDLEQLLAPLETTVRVASLHDDALDRAPGAVAILKADDIRNLGARTLQEALRFLPGVDVTVDNLGRSRIVVRGIGSSATGGASENVLVLWNGLRLNEDVRGGAFAANLDLPVEHVKQIELLRGPAGALYGDALAAVVNVIGQTTEELPGGEASVGFGSFGTQDYVLRSGGSWKDLRISGFVRFIDDDGARQAVAVDSQTTRDAAQPPPISRAPGTTTDDRRALEAAYRLDWRELRLDVVTRRDQSDGLVGYADALGKQNDLRTTRIATGLGWRRAATRLGDVTARFTFDQSEDRELLEVYPSGYRASSPGGPVQFGEPGGLGGAFLQTATNSRRVGLDGGFDRALGIDHRITGGLGIGRTWTFDRQADANLDFRTGSVPATGVPGALSPIPGATEPGNRTEFHAFLQDVWTRSSSLALTTGLRVDHGGDYGTVLLPRVVATGGLPEGLRKPLPKALGEGLGYRLLYGRSFRAPTLAELHFNLPGFAANPELSPATVHTIEMALGWKRGRFRAGAGYYLNLLRGAIATGAPFDVTRNAPPLNFPGTNVNGLELEASGGFGSSHTFFANYAWQHARARETGAPVAGVPSHLLNLGATFTWRERWSATSTLEVRSARPRAAGDPRSEVPAYGLVNLGARGRRLYKSLEAWVDVQNVFDKAYVAPAPAGGVPGDYPRPGRRVLVHASLRF
jgi:outer membrane receptor for ferrienterochelin and colicin